MYLNSLTEAEVNDAIDLIASEKNEVTIELFCSIHGNHDNSMTVKSQDKRFIQSWITRQLRDRYGYIDAYLS